MTLSSKYLAIIVMVILFGGILLTGWMGWWKTESSKVAAKFESGEFTGQANPADIRGSYTFGDVEKNFGVPVETLAEAFGIARKDADFFAVKELEALYTQEGAEIGTSSVRLFVAFYTGLPFDTSSEVYLPETAAKILVNRTLPAERAAYLQGHIVKSTEMTVAVGSPDSEEAGSPRATPTMQPTPAKSITEASSWSERTVKGKTTFQELLDWGLSRSAIEEILGEPFTELSGTVKDFCTANGLDFESVKAKLQAVADQLR